MMSAILLYLWVGFLHWLIADGWRPWHFMFWYPAEYYLGWRQRRDEQRNSRMAAVTVMTLQEYFAPDLPPAVPVCETCCKEWIEEPRSRSPRGTAFRKSCTCVQWNEQRNPRMAVTR